MIRLWNSAPLPLTVVFACAIGWAGPTMAQNLGNSGNAAIMWGTSTGTSSGAGDSGTQHATNGVAASQVNAAKKGLLYPSNISVYSVGVQNNISVIGSNNNISADQNGANSGNINTNGTIGRGAN